MSLRVFKIPPGHRRIQPIMLFLLVCLFLMPQETPADNIPNFKPIIPETFQPGEIVLHWTTPGDDGYAGQASGYEIRYQKQELGPIISDQKWDGAIPVFADPVPLLPGQIDSLIIRGLDYGAGYYFCMRSFDDARNYSELSNSPLILAGDTTSFIPGDANGSGNLSGLDVIYLIGYLRGRFMRPIPFLAGDTNGSCSITGQDVVYLIRFFKGGPAPVRGHCRP